jgi:hypothetical protein
VASVTALAHSTDAVAVLTGFRKRYPNIHEHLTKLMEQ